MSHCKSRCSSVFDSVCESAASHPAAVTSVRCRAVFVGRVTPGRDSRDALALHPARGGRLWHVGSCGVWVGLNDERGTERAVPLAAKLSEAA